jgi:DNA primase catalytic core
MARIPNDELERLKAEVSVQCLAEARGVLLKTHGNDLIGLCPFHDDHEPSLVISPKKNLWHCLGACQAGGSCIDWVMRAEGVSFRHAVELVRQRYSPTATPARTPKKTSVPKLPTLAASDADDVTLLGQVIDYYHETLKQSPQALAYLEKRGLVDPDVIDHFKLGFSNRTLGYRLPNKNRDAGAEARGRLQRLGVLRETGHEHFRGCLVVPVLNEHGHVTEVYGRRVEDGKPETPKHLYLPGPHRGVFNPAAFQVGREVILCEALIDALSFWCAGYRHVTASFGIEGFTPDLLSALERHHIERILIAYDADDAGDRAALALAKKLSPKGMACYRVHFPKGMDANAYALKVTPAKKSLGLVLEQATALVNATPRAKRRSLEEPVLTPEASEVTSTLEPKTETLLPLAAEPAATMTAPTMPEAPVEPVQPMAQFPIETNGQEIVMRLGDRRYRVRGLAKNLSVEQLKVNLLCSRKEAFHVDTLDLYAAKQRAAFQKQAASELGVKEDVIKHDLGKVLLALETLQEDLVKKTLEPKDKAPELTAAEIEEALELLKDPGLLDRILHDFAACGVVGEKTNKLLGYLACVSRKLEEPLAVVIQSSSAAGKSSLMEAILAFIPEEERVKYSAMTGQSLFYMGEQSLKHKVLAIVEEEGAERASYALKLLQSEGELTLRFRSVRHFHLGLPVDPPSREATAGPSTVQAAGRRS